MSAPPAPVSFAAIAKEKKKEADLVGVQVEGQVILKIAKHCREHATGTNVVTGQLLGLDVGQTLEVTDCFPFPVRVLLLGVCEGGVVWFVEPLFWWIAKVLRYSFCLGTYNPL